jgi:hypothetical protein
MRLYKDGRLVVELDAWGWGWTYEDVANVFSSYQREARADSYELIASLD